ncbi:MAG TPA: serine/threonine-protein kinase, partial [Gemmataceae bacterium]|nr:serine/threonine-protein kinase [Gemmataceae bacterium]
MTAEDSTARKAPVRSGYIPIPRSHRPSPTGFELLGELGRGGMGVVYKARQTALNRLVALKMILGGYYAHDADRLRFMAEAEAAASVKHPNVVQVYEFGYADEQPYFAMEYLDGGSLARRLAEFGPMPAAAAQLVEQVARGVQAAHDVGLIHRDLKPGNILLAKDEGRRMKDESNAGSDSAAPSSFTLHPSSFVPKVTDFGLAKRATGSDLTATGIVVGTPSYMAPEQAAGQGKLVGPPADVYALGAILYECLAGRPPFAAGNSAAILARGVNDDATPVRQFAPNTPADLELICLKCLAKLPAERYHSAAALADDLTRFLTGEPVSVRPAGRLEKVVKWVRRDPVSAVAYGLTLLTAASIGLTAGAIKLMREANAAKGFAITARDAATTEHGAAEAARKAADAATARAELAENQLRAAASPRSFELANGSFEGGDVARVRIGFVPVQLRSPRSPLPLPGGRMFVGGDGAGGCFDTTTGSVVHLLDPPPPGNVRAAVLSPDGARLSAVTRAGDVWAWDLKTGSGGRTRQGRNLAEPDSFGVGATSADLSRFLVRDSDERVVDAATGAVICRLAPRVPGPVHAAALSPDGTRAATGGHAGQTHVWDATTGRPLFELPCHGNQTRATAFSADGTRLATTSDDGWLQVWDLAARRAVLTVRCRGAGPELAAVGFGADGN